jgi:hypothetical protein
MTTLSKEQQEALMRRVGVQPELDISFDEINSFGDQESMLECWSDMAAYNKMLNEQITLINDSITAALPFTRENLYLFCAFTGSGKSTVAANISHPLWKQGKKVLIISNEEPKQDVLFRIAALELGYNFNDYKKGKMPIEEQRECAKLFPDIADKIKICDVTWKDGATTKIEGVTKALESIIGQGFSCVLIDYYQLIKDSISDKSKTRYDVLNDFRIWLGRYVKRCEVPVCLFVQLYSLGKVGGVKDIDKRIKECTAVVEPASVIIEIVPNWVEHTTDFIIHKDRFGFAGNKITCPFEKGKFLNQLSERELAERKLDRLEQDLDLDEEDK